MLFLAIASLASIASAARWDHRPDTLHHHNLAKRGFSGRATFWDVEDSEVACGGFYKHTQAVVALNFQQYGNPNARSSFCGKTVSISYNGKTTQAKIVDACEACGYGGLDMSTSLFNFFEDPDVGIFQMSWTVAGEDSGDDGDDDESETTTSSKKKATSTSSKKSTPTTTYYDEPKTTKKSSSYVYTPPTTSKATPTSYYSSSSSISQSIVNETLSQTLSGNATATASGAQNATATGKGSGSSGDFTLDGGVLQTVNQVVLGFAGLTAQLAKVAQN